MHLARGAVYGYNIGMVELYGKANIEALRKKTARWIAMAVGIVVLTLALCVGFCVCTRTANAERMLAYTIVTSILGGWTALTIRIFVIDELIYARKHTEAMLTDPRERVSGTFTVTKERVRIKRGVTMRKVKVDGAPGVASLQLYEGLANRFPQTGVTAVETVYGFIVAYEENGDAVG